jgi:hypothetical protein
MMDLPSDKARILRAYDVHKKWELVCGQQTVTVHGTPSEYIEKLRTFLSDNNKSTNKKVFFLDDSITRSTLCAETKETPRHGQLDQTIETSRDLPTHE